MGAQGVGCRVCGGNTRLAIDGLFDDRYGYPGRFDLFRCEQCGHATLHVQMSDAEVSRLYTEFYPRSEIDLDSFSPYQEEEGFSAWLNGTRSSAFRWVPRAVRVLDVGCGMGYTLGYHLARGCEALGVDPDENSRRVVDRFGYRIVQGVFRTGMFERGYFDYVTFDQVIEHFPDPLDALRAAAELLKPGGRIVLSTPNVASLGRVLAGRRWIHWHAPYHVSLFSPSSIRHAAAACGLQVETARSITPSDWIYFQWCSAIHPSVEGARSPFWTGQRQRGLKEGVLFRGLWALRKFGLHHLVARTLDALGVGDNGLYVLRRAP